MFRLKRMIDILLVAAVFLSGCSPVKEAGPSIPGNSGAPVVEPSQSSAASPVPPVQESPVPSPESVTAGEFPAGLSQNVEEKLLDYKKRIEENDGMLLYNYGQKAAGNTFVFYTDEYVVTADYENGAVKPAYAVDLKALYPSRYGSDEKEVEFLKAYLDFRLNPSGNLLLIYSYADGDPAYLYDLDAGRLYKTDTLKAKAWIDNDSLLVSDETGLLRDITLGQNTVLHVTGRKFTVPGTVVTPLGNNRFLADENGRLSVMTLVKGRESEGTCELLAGIPIYHNGKYAIGQNVDELLFFDLAADGVKKLPQDYLKLFHSGDIEYADENTIISRTDSDEGTFNEIRGTFSGEAVALPGKNIYFEEKIPFAGGVLLTGSSTGNPDQDIAKDYFLKDGGLKEIKRNKGLPAALPKDARWDIEMQNDGKVDLLFRYGIKVYDDNCNLFEQTVDLLKP
jgi:hypothetical protein